MRASVSPLGELAFCGKPVRGKRAPGAELGVRPQKVRIIGGFAGFRGKYDDVKWLKYYDASQLEAGIVDQCYSRCSVKDVMMNCPLSTVRQATLLELFWRARRNVLFQIMQSKYFGNVG
jgi:hypothetical protein